MDWNITHHVGDNALTAISVARQCHIVDSNQRIFLGDIAEKKVDGKDVIDWKDFECSERHLNFNLEPDLEYGDMTVYANNILEGNHINYPRPLNIYYRR